MFGKHGCYYALHTRKHHVRVTVRESGQDIHSHNSGDGKTNGTLTFN